jgi:hypothetical protein
VKRGPKDIRGWNPGRALFVADSGMNSKENPKELAVIMVTKVFFIFNSASDSSNVLIRVR